MSNHNTLLKCDLKFQNKEIDFNGQKKFFFWIANHEEFKKNNIVNNVLTFMQDLGIIDNNCILILDNISGGNEFKQPYKFNFTHHCLNIFYFCF